MLGNSAYLFLAKTLGYGIRILLPVFLVRILTKADFGAYNQFFLIEIMFKTVFQMGVNQSQFFFVPRDLRNAGSYFINSLMLNVGLFVVAYSIIGGFRGEVADFLGMEILRELFWPLAIYSLLMMLNVTAETYLVARKLFIQSAVFDILRQVLASAATLAAAYITRDLESIIQALVWSRAVSLVGVLLYIHLKHNGFQSEKYFFGLGKQVKYGLMLGMAGMLWTFLMRMNELTVSRFYDIETYAVYAAGCKQIPIIQFFAQSISAVALVQFAQLEKENNWDGIRALWDKILGSLYGVGLPVTVFFIAIAQPLITLMFTPEYSDAVIIFQINSIAMLYHLLNPTLILRAMDRNDISVKVHAGLVAVLPFALYLGMKGFGLVGIISVHAAMLILGRVVNHMVLNRVAPIPLPFVPSRVSLMEFYKSTWTLVRSKSQE
ncbi:MAG: O-antigen/teichoic acid export membrane protein, partial [Candidatus Krumholzibacteriia bacterium]